MPSASTSTVCWVLGAAPCAYCRCGEQTGLRQHLSAVGRAALGAVQMGMVLCEAKCPCSWCPVPCLWGMGAVGLEAALMMPEIWEQYL